MRKPRSIKQRAAAYAQGKISMHAATVGEYPALAGGWEDGYRAAVRDVRTRLHDHYDNIDVEVASIVRAAREELIETINSPMETKDE